MSEYYDYEQWKDEAPLPSEGVLSDKETAKQLRKDSCRQYVDEIKKLQEQHEQLANSLMQSQHKVECLKASIHAAHGLLAPLGNQTIPSVLAIREALSILRGAI